MATEYVTDKHSTTCPKAISLKQQRLGTLAHSAHSNLEVAQSRGEMLFVDLSVHLSEWFQTGHY